MLEIEFIRRKIKLIQEDCGKLDVLSNYTLEEIARDFIKMNAVERLLEKIVMRAIDINQHIVAEIGRGDEHLSGYEDTFYILSNLEIYPMEFAKKIAPSAGLRNRLVHEYNSTKEEIVYKSVGDAISQYVKYCEYILKFTERKEFVVRKFE